MRSRDSRIAILGEHAVSSGSRQRAAPPRLIVDRSGILPIGRVAGIDRDRSAGVRLHDRIKRHSWVARLRLFSRLANVREASGRTNTASLQVQRAHRSAPEAQIDDRGNRSPDPQSERTRLARCLRLGRHHSAFRWCWRASGLPLVISLGGSDRLPGPGAVGPVASTNVEGFCRPEDRPLFPDVSSGHAA